MNTKHTPGPWRYSYGKYIEAPRGNAVVRIAIVDDGAGTESGNGCLLAAAPDLLAALELCLEELDSCDHEFEGTHYCGRCDSTIDRSHEIREKAAKAIAKAKVEHD